MGMCVIEQTYPELPSGASHTPVRSVAFVVLGSGPALPLTVWHLTSGFDLLNLEWA